MSNETKSRKPYTRVHITEDEIYDMVQRRLARETLEEIAAVYGVNRNTVCGLTKDRMGRVPAAGRVPCGTEEDIAVWRQRMANGESIETIANERRVSITTIAHYLTVGPPSKDPVRIEMKRQRKLRRLERMRLELELAKATL